MERLGLVAPPRWRALVAPAVFLLAVTVAVVLYHTTRSHSAPAPVRLIQTKVQVVPSPRFYTVAAGDTVVGIAAKTGIPAARIRALNPSVRPTALFIGEKIRLG